PRSVDRRAPRCALANSPQSNETARIEDSPARREAEGRRPQTEGATAEGVAQGARAVRSRGFGPRHLAHLQGVWNLRSKHCFEAIERCFAEARERFGLRIRDFVGTDELSAAA